MFRRKNFVLMLTGFLLFLVIFSYLNYDSEQDYVNYENPKNLNTSIKLDGIENTIITEVVRKAWISGYGLLRFEDSLEVTNLNNNPISSILFGIPKDISDDLIFLEATGLDQNTLLIEQSSLLMNGLEIVIAYFNSPLKPHQTRLIQFVHIYKNLITYIMSDEQVLITSGAVYPLVPYKMEGTITSLFSFPETALNVDGGWGYVDNTLRKVTYYFDSIKDDLGIDFITPFLENLGENARMGIFFSESEESLLEMKEIHREIFISPWGIIKVNEEFSIENLGVIDILGFSLKIPLLAKNVYLSDRLGEILGVTIENSDEYKNVEVQLFQNRVRLTPNTAFTFNIEYYLPFERFVSINGFQESLKIDLLLTIFDYLGRDQTIDIIIEGCYRIDSITEAPEAIKKSESTTTLTYTSEFVCSFESKLIQITFTIDFFNLLLRPIIFILVIAVIASIYVLIIKARKKEQETAVVTQKVIPINEIREFCSLNEEKNALTLEIRQAEEDTKRKKIAKKKYRNILEQNASKIGEIQKEIIPFKKILLDASETFKNILKRLDVLEAERMSVEDSLKLLEARYKKGRLPSRAAFQKLSEDFKKRRRKIDRTIDKLLQQLRSYLL